MRQMPLSLQLLLRRRWLYASFFAEHSLLAEQYWDDGLGARWLIGRPKSNVYRTEIIAGTIGSLVVHGDIQLCRFAYGGGNAWERLTWMAFSNDVDYYVAQKANIGLGDLFEPGYDAEVALDDLRQYASELRELDESAGLQKLLELLEEAEAHTEHVTELRHFLSEGDAGWDLWEHRFGEVVPCHVLCAHAALNKCAALLLERHGKGGPPACDREAIEPADEEAP